MRFAIAVALAVGAALGVRAQALDSADAAALGEQLALWNVDAAVVANLTAVAACPETSGAVRCNGGGRVTELLLRAAALSGLLFAGGGSGKAPPPLTRLGALRVLDLRENALGGSLDGAALGALTQLRTLRVAGNRLRGPLPAAALSALGSLTVCELLDAVVGGQASPDVNAFCCPLPLAQLPPACRTQLEAATGADTAAAAARCAQAQLLGGNACLATAATASSTAATNTAAYVPTTATATTTMTPPPLPPSTSPTVTPSPTTSSLPNVVNASAIAACAVAMLFAVCTSVGIVVLFLRRRRRRRWLAARATVAEHASASRRSATNQQPEPHSTSSATAPAVARASRRRSQAYAGPPGSFELAHWAPQAHGVGFDHRLCPAIHAPLPLLALSYEAAAANSYASTPRGAALDDAPRRRPQPLLAYNETSLVAAEAAKAKFVRATAAYDRAPPALLAYNETSLAAAEAAKAQARLAAP